ncbi:MAG: ester cyclase [Massilia sp.]|nr:ester cyclase [Massilia sp.]
MLTGFRGVRFELHDVFGETDKVAARWTFRAVHGGRFAGIRPSHAEVTQEGNVIYQVRDGRIVRAWLQADRLGVLQQIGVVPRAFVPRAFVPRAFVPRAFAEAQGQRPI